MSEEIKPAKVVEEKHGIEELKEALRGAFALSLFSYKRFSDGVDVGDFSAFYSKFKDDDEFRKVLSEAWEGRQKIPQEAGDIDMLEGTELMHLVIDFIQDFIRELKNK